MKDTSIFKSVVEFNHAGTDYRFMREGATWGAYTRNGDAYVRQATVYAPSRASTRKLLDAFRTQSTDEKIDLHFGEIERA